MVETEMQQDLGRAKNALQDYLIHKLLIPKVYLDADWNGAPVDVLAIDRAGVGDVHAVRMFVADYKNENYIWTLRNFVQSLRSHPSHFRYVALVNEAHDVAMSDIHPEDSTYRSSLAEDGVGRIGILYVDLSEDNPTVQVKLKAERFRSSKEIVDLADRYVAEHTANWEVRE